MAGFAPAGPPRLAGRGARLATFVASACVLASGCVTTPGFVRFGKVVGDDVDDLSPASLALAAERSAEALERMGSKSFYVEGGRELPVQWLARSARRVAEISREAESPEDLTRRLTRDCRAWLVGAPGEAGDQGKQGDDGNQRSAGSMGSVGKFTGYYEPLLDARTSRDARFRYPIYAAPTAGHKHELDRRLGRAPTRADIDQDGALEGLGLELAWLDDPVARFFLHVQGSGLLRFGDGREQRVGFAASNDLAYRSVGSIMLERGLLERGNASATAMRSWLGAHPAERDGLLEQNPRYIFFRETGADGPVGSLGSVLVPGRSIATDPRFVPAGALTWLRTTRPVVDREGKLVEKRPLTRFAFAQDTGAAIQGPARVDLFVGSGEEAGLEAGAMNEAGEVYVLLCGPRSPGGPITGPYGAPYGRRVPQL